MDQALTLRRMMDSRDGKLFGGPHAIPVHSFLEARPGDGASSVLKKLKAWMSQESSSVLCVDDRSRGIGFEKQGTYVTDVSLFYLRSKRIDESLEELGYQAVFIDSDSDAFQHSGIQSTIILTPDESSLLEAYRNIKNLNRNHDVKKMNIIVNSVGDEREGMRVFLKLYDTATRFLDVELQYLGCVQRDEKNSDSGCNPDFLISFKSGIDSIAKRLGLVKSAMDGARWEK